MQPPRNFEGLAGILDLPKKKSGNHFSRIVLVSGSEQVFVARRGWARVLSPRNTASDAPFRL